MGPLGPRKGIGGGAWSERQTFQGTMQRLPLALRAPNLLWSSLGRRLLPDPMRQGGSERLGELPEVTQPGHGGVSI